MSNMNVVDSFSSGLYEIGDRDNLRICINNSLSSKENKKIKSIARSRKIIKRTDKEIVTISLREQRGNTLYNTLYRKFIFDMKNRETKEIKLILKKYT